MTNEKIRYIINQNKKNPRTEITIDIDSDLIEAIKIKSSELNISVDEYIEIVIIEKLLKIEKEKYSEENIIDIYDFYRLDELIDSKKNYLVLNPNGNHAMLLPINYYNDMKLLVSELEGSGDFDVTWNKH